MNTDKLFAITAAMFLLAAPAHAEWITTQPPGMLVSLLGLAALITFDARRQRLEKRPSLKQH